MALTIAAIAVCRRCCKLGISKDSNFLYFTIRATKIRGNKLWHNKDRNTTGAHGNCPSEPAMTAVPMVAQRAG